MPYRQLSLICLIPMLLSGCCMFRPRPVEPFRPPPELITPITPESLANKLITSLLIRSPLIQGRHLVAIESLLSDNVVHQEALLHFGRKLGLQSNIRLTDAQHADFRLTAVAEGKRTRITMLDRNDTTIWHYELLP